MIVKFKIQLYTVIRCSFIQGCIAAAGAICGSGNATSTESMHGSMPFLLFSVSVREI